MTLPSGREDPGPPPARGLVVRPQGEGFYARVSPRPMPAFRVWGPAVAGFVVVGLLLAFVFGDDGWLAFEIVVSIVLFGTLIIGFGVGGGFFPVEIVVDDTTVNWGGERYPMSVVGDCRAIERTLELVGRDDRILARIDGVPPDVGRWVSLAIRASLPTT